MPRSLKGRGFVGIVLMPVLVRFLMRHAAIGFGIAVAFVGLLVAFDVGGLHTLLARAPEGWLAAGILTFAMGLTFSSVQMGVAVMLLPDDDSSGGGRRRRIPALRTGAAAMQPALAQARRG